MVISQSKSIQKKLLAATAMLLVACIMLISASYAWFTLSTAPEITGITTTIGANGNLEIALAHRDTWADPDGTKTTVGSSEVEDLNISWGNLIDLSNDSYGLSEVTLLPSRLNLISVGTNLWGVHASPLQVPVYEADGRISNLSPMTSYGKYNGSDYAIIANTNPDPGVRVIGSATGMTSRQLAYKNAKIDLISAMALAKAEARASLTQNGSELANIVIKYAADSSATYTSEELAVIGVVVEQLNKAQQSMVVAWEKAVIGYAASKECESVEGLKTEQEFAAFKDKIEKKEYQVSQDGKTVTAGEVSLVLPDAFAVETEGDQVLYLYANIKGIKDSLDAAKKAYDKLSGDAIQWTELRAALDYIVKADKITVNDFTSTEIKDNASQLASSVLGSGIQVEMKTGAGVYADIADFCGNYSANIKLAVKMGDLDLGTPENPLPATMKTLTDITPVYFERANNKIGSASAPIGAGEANNKLSDMYGYVIDYYMRTNAQNAQLLLQEEGAQRIYTDGSNEETMGGGSYMLFTSADEKYTTTQMVKLMGAIRVVFIIPGDGDSASEVLGVAKLDLTDPIVEGNTVKASLKLCDYTVAEAGGKLTVNDFKESQVITTMTQNQAMKISTLVYLDGDYVTNDMVANNTQSMVGKLNLQFATDTKLVPMEDTALKEGK